jgi:hypothetical protein
VEGAPNDSVGTPPLTDLAIQDKLLRIDLAARKAFDSFYFEQHNMSRSGIGKMYEEHRNWKSFLAIGKICDEHGWDPGDYVSTVFRSVAANGGIVLPGNLTTSSAIAHYAKEKQRTITDPEDAWNASERVVTELILNGRTEKQVLANPMISLPAWFRVVYPEELDKDLFERYGERARSELFAGQEVLEFARVKNSRTVETLLSIWGDQPTDNQQPSQC